MTKISASPSTFRAPAHADGFDVLDLCHRHTVLSLGKLAALTTRLRVHGPDDEARSLATEILHHFAGAARQQHEDEERHVFPRLTASDDAELVQNVLRLQQDTTGWNSNPTSPRSRTATSGTTWICCTTAPPLSPHSRTTT